MLSALQEKKDGQSVFTNFMGTPAPFTAKDLQDNDFLNLLKSINIPLLPAALEDGLDDHLVDWFAKQPRSRHLFSFVQRGGWYSADAFIVWLQAKMDSGTYQGKPRQFSQMTLEEHFAATRKELTVVAADTTGESMLVLNHRTAPQCPLVWAVRMSMSIPLLWQEVVWQSGWGPYYGQDISGHTIVDGGLLSCFPLELYLSNLKDVTDVMGPKVDDPVLGLLIDETLPVPGTDQPTAKKASIDLEEFHTVRRISSLIDTAISAHDKMVIDAYEKIVVHLPAKGYGTTEFNMSDLRQQLLVSAGRQAMAAYLSQHAPEGPTPSQDEVKRNATAVDRVAGRILDRSVRKMQVALNV
jgi:predicted acylesterase/phospholipase RssA